MIAMLMLGSALGLGIAVARDLLDGAVRTRRQVEGAAPAPFLGYLPKFDIGGFTMRRIAKRSKRLLDPVGHKFAAGPAYSIVLSAPFSRFAETLRNVKVAADQMATEPARVIGIISPLANEGRTTVAVNLARLVAQSGARVLLIDGDLRNPELSKNLSAENTPGLVQLVRGEAHVGDLLWSDQATRLDFLPAGAEPKLVNANEILSSPQTQAFIEASRRQYSLVIVDLPAVLPVVDVRAAAHLFDGFVLVVEWGATTEDVLAQAFHTSGVADKVMGTVLNKANLATLKRFEHRETAFGNKNYLESYRHTA